MTRKRSQLILLVMVSLGGSFCQGKGWRDVTANSTSAPCWFDMKPASAECATCTSEGTQCGYPMHNRCRYNQNGLNKKGWIKGCKGISRKKYTLSQTGYPCPWDPKDRSCPWCSANNVLCFLNGRIRCYEENTMIHYLGDTFADYCKTQDCLGFPEACHPKASCKEFQYERLKLGPNDWGFTQDTIHRCVCDPGFIGNGVTCANATTGVVFESVEAEKLKLSVSMARDGSVDEGLWDQKPLGNATDELYNKVENLPTSTTTSGQSNSTSAICIPVGTNFHDEL